jgi:hypothetical protein
LAITPIWDGKGKSILTRSFQYKDGILLSYAKCEKRNIWKFEFVSNFQIFKTKDEGHQLDIQMFWSLALVRDIVSNSEFQPARQSAC